MTQTSKIRPYQRRGLAVTALFSLILAGATLSGFNPVRAAETPVFKVEMNDGVVTPNRIEIPANKVVKIIVRNTGKTPAEFESLRLRKEKLLAPGASADVIIRNVAPGKYPFYDEFHMKTSQGVIIAR